MKRPAVEKMKLFFYRGSLSRLRLRAEGAEAGLSPVSYESGSEIAHGDTGGDDHKIKAVLCAVA